MSRSYRIVDSTPAIFDLTQYTHTKIGTLPNVLWARNNERQYALEPTPFIRPPLDELIHTVAIKHPEWTFIADAPWGYARAIEDSGVQSRDIIEVPIADFEVFHDKEKLGSISANGYLRNKPAFQMINHRISEKRQRGTGTKTTDIKKALRIVEKEFGRRSMSEKLSLIKAEGVGAISTAWYNTKSNSDTVQRYFLRHMEEYLAENYEKYRDIAIGKGAKTDMLDKWDDHMRATQVATEIKEAHDVGNALFVHTTSTLYAAIGTLNKDVAYHTWTSDTVPDVVRRKVGMLKLVENNTFLPDIGFRISDDVFLILKETENGNEQ